MPRLIDRLGPRPLVGAALLVVTPVAAAALVVARGLTLAPEDAIRPTLVVIGLGALAWRDARRQTRQFVLPLIALATLVGFTVAYTPLMYAVATTGQPWIDSLLAGGDELCGFSAPGCIAWLRSWPLAEDALWLAYFSAIPQTMLLIAWFGLRGERAPLEKFLVRFMLAALACLVVFAWAPARGSCAFYGFDVPSHYQPILLHLDELRDGTRTLVGLRDAQGLITCPSFHTTWALLLTLAFWPSRLWRWPMSLLNTAMVAATVPVGMHYLMDVLGGTAVAMGAVGLDLGLARLVAATAGAAPRSAAIVSALDDVDRKAA